MKNFREKVLAAGASVNPILACAMDGLAPEEFKRQIIENFAPFFTRRDLLEKYAIDLLAAELVNLAKVRSSTVGQAAFDHARAIYESAEKVDATRTYMSFAAAEKAAAAGREEFWSAYFLSPSLDSLDLPEFKHEAFRLLGGLIESWMQPLLRDLLAQLRISRGRGGDFSTLHALSLGNIVGELHDVTHSDLYAPVPWGLRLNQWRNMAQHYRSSIDGTHIEGWYGEPGKERSVKLTRDELVSVIRTCIAVFDGFRLARSLFGLDRIEGVKPYLPALNARPEVALLSLVTAIATQGFETIDAAVAADRSQLWLRDIRGGERQARLTHASQFVYALWMNTESVAVEVHVCAEDGSVAASFGATGADCLDYAERRIDQASFVDRMTFKIFSMDSPQGSPNSTLQPTPTRAV